MKAGYIIKNFLWDIILMIVLVINLLMLCWDWIFSMPNISNYLIVHAPQLYNWYSPIHNNIKIVDLIFVIIYVVDIIAGWCVSVFKKKESFYEYPLTHWYDFIGCIPAGSLVILRLLRIVSIVIRLHKKKIINIFKITIFKRLLKFYNIVIEEISDRVVLNILGGIKSNVTLGMPITHDVINKIVKPNKERIIDIIVDKVHNVVTTEYNRHKKDIESYITEKSHTAVVGNKELSKLKLIPVVGNQISATIEHSVSRTVNAVVENVVSDFISDDGREYMRNIANEIADCTLEDLENQMSDVTADIVAETVALIARTTNVKQWKLAEIREKIDRVKASPSSDPAILKDLEKLYIDEFNKSLSQELRE